jgi:hypothetical protein
MSVHDLPTTDEFTNALNKQIQSLDHMKYQKFFLQLYRGIVKAITNFLESFTNSLASVNDGSMVWARNIAIVFIVIFVVFIVIVIGFVIRNMRKDTKLRFILGEELDENSTVTTLQEKAQILYEKSEYRLAIRFRFIGMLLHLHETNILHHDESMTGLEMIKHLKEVEFTASSSFERLVSLFNLFWYGKDSIQLEDYDEWMTSEDEFWKEAQPNEKT